MLHKSVFESEKQRVNYVVGLPVETLFLTMLRIKDFRGSFANP